MVLLYYVSFALVLLYRFIASLAASRIRFEAVYASTTHLPSHLNLQQQLSRSLPPLQIFMRLPHILERVDLMNLDVKLAIEDGFVEFAEVVGEF